MIKSFRLGHCFPPHAYAYKGGVPSSTPPPAIPPVTERSIEVDAAARQIRQDAAKRKGYKSTLLAPLDRYGAGSKDGMKKTLLGQ